jgi:hypothetical protein
MSLASPSHAPKISKKEMIAMNRTSSNIKGVMDNLRMQLKVLDAEIKADEKSKEEFERYLNVLKTKQLDLQTRINFNQEFGKQYDTDIGPFANKYKEMTAEIGKIYNQAKIGHQNGIKLLEKEFNYHPAFKRPTDTFFAIPFRPI